MDASDLDANSLRVAAGPGNPHDHALLFRGEPAESGAGVDMFLISLDHRAWLITIPFGPPEPSDSLLNKSVSSTRLRAWLNTRLRQLAVGQRVQDARALRSEFLVE